jgi:hypothetical protein
VIECDRIAPKKYRRGKAVYPYSYWIQARSAIASPRKALMIERDRIVHLQRSHIVMVRATDKYWSSSDRTRSHLGTLKIKWFSCMSL